MATTVPTLSRLCTDWIEAYTAGAYAPIKPSERTLSDATAALVPDADEMRLLLRCARIVLRRHHKRLASATPTTTLDLRQHYHRVKGILEDAVGAMLLNAVYDDYRCNGACDGKCGDGACVSVCGLDAKAIEGAQERLIDAGWHVTHDRQRGRLHCNMAAV